jgi:hypothetical protein
MEPWCLQGHMLRFNTVLSAIFMARSRRLCQQACSVRNIHIADVVVS